ncbi:hypothetical protein HRI_004394400 [Hibiscus trionum]|uniref:Uncharacterized protein n=1 Tax=Hibiscus trionum TaxID=183268 RepID=A0A9W7J3B0_HIBTR|nr:hypothetical protein HRI_004394400 [Hibiscus trionum]
MAGMLPGVECARRRRIRPNGGLSGSSTSAAVGSTRKSALCLYATANESHFGLQKQRSIVEACEDEKLGGTARKAKKRLDEKLRSQRTSPPKRHKSNRGGLLGDDM